MLHLSLGAKVLLQEYYEATERAQSPSGELAHVRPYGSKTAEQAARIAGVMTLWVNLDARKIEPSTMADAIVLAQFYLSDAGRLADAAIVSEKVEQAELLRKWALDSWEGDFITPSDVLRYDPNSLRESEKIKPVIVTLAKHGWWVSLPTGAIVSGKKRKEAYRIVRS